MQTILAWILVALVLAAAYPWAAWLVTRSPRPPDFWLIILLALALGPGALTLLMFWLALLGFRFDVWAITLPYFALMLPGYLLWRREGARIAWPVPPASRLERLALLALALVGGAVLFNAAYWPFYRDDALAIYARYGRIMAESGTLVPFAGRNEAFYQAYPVQIPLVYAYTYLASGWLNEYLARVIPSLFSLGCIPAVYILGKNLFDSLAGWLGALLLALTPTFARWASSGYVDLPMAFAYTLAAVFAWRLWSDGRGVDALLAGLMMGLAAWTKNAALLGVVFLVIWLAYGWLRRRFGLRTALIALLACAVVAAPWYARNWAEARLLVPPTAWTDQAAPTLNNLLILITLGNNFGLPGWLMLGGVFYGLWVALRRGRQSPEMLLLLLWTLPFFSVWWLLVSYDPRFILLFLPPLAALGGGWLAAVWNHSPQQRMRPFIPLFVALMLALAAYNAWIGVDYKQAILGNPLMGDAEKHEIVLRGR